MANTILQVDRSELRAELKELYAEIRMEAERAAIIKASERLITPEQAADTLKVSKVTLWRWEKSGYLVPVSIGGKKRYRRVGYGEKEKEGESGEDSALNGRK